MVHKEVCRYTDKYGDDRKIHRDHRGRLAIARTRHTTVILLTNAVAPMIGKQIKKARLEKGWTLDELAQRAGLIHSVPKNRMWSIENPGTTGRGGIRFGTLYAIAIALRCEVSDLLPSTSHVLLQTELTQSKTLPTLIPKADG